MRRARVPLQGHINPTLRIYYTHADAAREKGSAENVNRHICRFSPKGTDFRRVTGREIAAMRDFINSVPRCSTLKGKTAMTFFSPLPKALAHFACNSPSTSRAKRAGV